MTSFNFLSVALDARRLTCGKPEMLAARQRERLNEVVAFARANSRFYAEKYRGLPEIITDVRQLPPVTKLELMEHFDDVITDPAAKRARWNTSPTWAIWASPTWESTWSGQPPAPPGRQAYFWKTKTGTPLSARSTCCGSAENGTPAVS
jgi:hypothetical protein